jgi:hypothetical protein
LIHANVKKKTRKSSRGKLCQREFTKSKLNISVRVKDDIKKHLEVWHGEWERMGVDIRHLIGLQTIRLSEERKRICWYQTIKHEDI